MNKLKVNVWKDNNGNNITFANIDTTNNTILINTPANVLVDDYDTPLDKFIDSIPTSENSTISLIFDNSVVAKQCYELSDKHSNKYLRFNIDSRITFGNTIIL
jgi:DNA recombination-dependent growth factor C